MEQQPPASGDDTSVDPDHMSIDDSKPPVPQSCSQSGTRTRLVLGHVEYAEDVTERMIRSDQIRPHEDQLKELLEDLQDLMTEEDFKNVQCVVEISKNQTPDERTSVFKLLLYLKKLHGTPDKMRKTASSSSSSSSAAATLYLYTVKVYPVVTGRTCGADEAILEHVKKVGWFSKTHVEITADLQDCDIIILFCPIVSRVGIDVDAAMRKVPGHKKVILVLMHHTRHEDYSVDEKKRWSDDFNNVVLCVHVLFHATQPGLLKCKRNNKAVQQIRDELKKHSKINF